MIAHGFSYPVGTDHLSPDTSSYTDGRTSYTGWSPTYGFLDPKYGSSLHTGEDWNGAGGKDTDLLQPVYSAAGGCVVFSGDGGSGWGNIILIAHRAPAGSMFSLPSGSTVDLVWTQYAHLAEVAATVHQGARITAAQEIGTIGKGYFLDKDHPVRTPAYAAHLHFEVRIPAPDDDPEAWPLPENYWPTFRGKSADWVRARYVPPSEFIRLNPPLRTSLVAVPDSGEIPLLVDLGARVFGGFTTGAITYAFYCNRNDDTTDFGPIGSWDHRFDLSPANPQTVVGACAYTTPGTYHPKVIVRRQGGLAQDRITVHVSPNACPAGARAANCPPSSTSSTTSTTSPSTTTTSTSATTSTTSTTLQPGFTLLHSPYEEGVSCIDAPPPCRVTHPHHLRDTTIPDDRATSDPISLIIRPGSGSTPESLGNVTLMVTGVERDDLPLNALCENGANACRGDGVGDGVAVPIGDFIDYRFNATHGTAATITPAQFASVRFLVEKGPNIANGRYIIHLLAMRESEPNTQATTDIVVVVGAITPGYSAHVH